MEYIGAMLITLGVGLGLYTAIESGRQDARLASFEQRCEAKGGVTLRGYKHGSGWIGCYKAQELENE